jgi:hypothetical protein
MIAAQHHVESAFNRDSDFDHESFADSLELGEEFRDSGIGDGVCLGEQAATISEQRLLLRELMQLTFSSLSSYHELAELAAEPALKSFAEVIVRQRSAQLEELRRLSASAWSLDRAAPREALSALRSIWRLAIWYYEQDHQAEFAEYAERAESLLEEAFLAMAGRVTNEEWEPTLRSHAIAICGARSVWEEFGQRWDADSSTAAQ